MYFVPFLVESYMYYPKATPGATVTKVHQLAHRTTKDVLYIFPLLHNVTKLPVERALLLWGQRSLPSRAWVL